MVPLFICYHESLTIVFRRSDRATNPSHPPTEVPAVLETDRQLLEVTPPATLHAGMFILSYLVVIMS